MPFEKVAQALARDGYAYVMFDAALVAQAQSAYQVLTRSLGAERSSWAITRPNEAEAELGFISRSGTDSDQKMFFHFAFDLRERLMTSGVKLTKQQDVCLESIDLLYQALKSLTRRIACGFLHSSFGCEILQSIDEGFKPGVAYGASTLRFLHYPNTEDQRGAREHFDRSFLTIHLGDRGGALLALVDGEWVDVSPPQGYALLFFGVKAMYASSGAITPLRHMSTTTPTCAREAVVMFVHGDVGLTVHNAQATYEALNEENQL